MQDKRHGEEDREKINTEAWSSAFLTAANVAPQSSEQMASDRSARKRLVIACASFPRGLRKFSPLALEGPDKRNEIAEGVDTEVGQDFGEVPFLDWYGG